MTTPMNENQKPQLMEGCEDRQLFRQPDEARFKRREEYPFNLCAMVAENTAERVKASRELFPWQFFRGDCHSHTQHSDGIGTVEETARMVEKAGLDFQYVTDHWGLTQAPECREYSLWVGQEPTTKLHHMGVLGLDQAFTPQQDFLADMAAAQAMGATVFVPHPTGWWPKVIYAQESLDLLDELPTPFLMEICNGANNVISAFDYTDESARKVWDSLLLKGKVVHAMGNTDAHAPHAIGMVWNSVFADTCDEPSIIAALKQGHSFVSDAPLVHIALGDARMGDKASPADRGQQFEFTAVDSHRLMEVCVIADGEEIFSQNFKTETSFKGTISIPASVKKYVRVEVRSRDGRQAYSNPIYLS